MMLVISLHIANCIDADKSSDKRNDNTHQYRKPVHHHMRSLRHLRGKFHVQHQHRLQYGQNHGEHPFVPDTQPDDQTHKKDISRRHQMVYGLCPWIEHPCLRSAANPVRNKHNRHGHDRSGTRIDNITPYFFISDYLKNHCQHCRNSNQEWYHRCCPPFISSLFRQ